MNLDTVHKGLFSPRENPRPVAGSQHGIQYG